MIKILFLYIKNIYFFIMQTVNKLEYLIRKNKKNLDLIKNQTISISDEEYTELYTPSGQHSG